MNAFKDYDEVKAYSGAQEKLPAGGYSGKIIGAKVVTYQGKNGSFDKLEIAVDVNDGEYIDYFKNQFEASTVEGKKWKGVLRLYVPTDDGSDGDALTKRIFKGAITAIEESNNGYHWDWNEGKLKGKLVGFLVRDKEYDFNGKQGFAPEVFSFVSLRTITEGKYKTPKPKLLNGDAPAAPTPPPPPANNGADDYPF